MHFFLKIKIELIDRNPLIGKSHLILRRYEIPIKINYHLLTIKYFYLLHLL